MNTCGTCKRWDQDRQEGRPASIRTTFTGKCQLNGKVTNYGSMVGCFGWKEADREELARRGFGQSK
jgi:hypothetical protein